MKVVWTTKYAKVLAKAISVPIYKTFLYFGWHASHLIIRLLDKEEDREWIACMPAAYILYNTGQTLGGLLKCKSNFTKDIPLGLPSRGTRSLGLRNDYIIQQQHELRSYIPMVPLLHLSIVSYLSRNENMFAQAEWAETWELNTWSH